MCNQKEIEMTYTNWEIDDIVLDVARLIKDGFTIASYTCNHSWSETETTVRLIEVHKF